MKPWVGWSIAVAVVVVIALPVGMKLRGGGETRDVEMQVIGERVLSPTVLASGTLTYQTEIKLVSEVIGRVKEILVKEGDLVKSGDLLLRLDPATALAEVAQLEAALAQSRLSIERQQVTATTQAARFKRYQSLREQGVIDANTFDDVASNHELAQVELRNSSQVLRQTEAQLRQARERLAKTEIRAPLTGRVTALFIKTGETAVPSVTSIAGSDLMVIADTSNLFAEINVNETDVARVGPGQTAQIVPAAFPDQSWKGVVETVAVSPRTVAGQSKSYPVKIRIGAVGELQFHTGMSCRAEVSTRNTSANATLAVPVAAVRYEEVANRNERAKSSLLLVENGRIVQREVETGIADDDFIEIVKGAKAGDQLVTGPTRTLRFLKAGDRVNATAAPAEATSAKP
ncbi:MAG: efflux RND transporter periplasmic adaptor subunit [Steroidobacteraceae bacterium]